VLEVVAVPRGIYHNAKTKKSKIVALFAVTLLVKLVLLFSMFGSRISGTFCPTDKLLSRSNFFLLTFA
jgi:hypothetical protein